MKCCVWTHLSRKNTKHLLNFENSTRYEHQFVVVACHTNDFAAVSTVKLESSAIMTEKSSVRDGRGWCFEKLVLPFWKMFLKFPGTNWGSTFFPEKLCVQRRTKTHLMGTVSISRITISRVFQGYNALNKWPSYWSGHEKRNNGGDEWVYRTYGTRLWSSVYNRC